MVTLKNLPVGTSYSVVETDNAGREMKDHIVTSVSNRLYSCADGMQSGIVSADAQNANTLQFTNTEHDGDSSLNADGKNPENTNSPETGDIDALWLWSVVLFASAEGILLLVKEKKRMLAK